MKDELKWQTFFDEDYLRIWSADLGESRSVADLEFLLRALELAPGMRVLDAPCGYGGRAAISYSWQGPGGGGQKASSVRMYAVTELVRLLEQAGLRFCAALRSPSGAPFNARGPAMGGRVGLLCEHPLIGGLGARAGGPLLAS
jgi:hypothetical protein